MATQLACALRQLSSSVGLDKTRLGRARDEQHTFAEAVKLIVNEAIIKVSASVTKQIAAGDFDKALTEKRGLETLALVEHVKHHETKALSKIQ